MTTHPSCENIALAGSYVVAGQGDDKYWATVRALHHVGDGGTLSTQWEVALDANDGKEPSEAFMLQLRYRF